MNCHKDNRGFSLVEIVIAGALLVLLITGLAGMMVYGIEGSTLAGSNNRGLFLAQEGLEAVRNISENNFSNIIDGVYGLATTSNQWALGGASDTVGIYNRKIEISTVDNNTKKVVSTVAWRKNARREGLVSLTTYFTNWVSSFLGKWAYPSIESGLSFNDTIAGSDVMIDGDYAYIILAGGSPNFYIIDLSDTINPTVVGSTTVVPVPFALYIKDGFAYITGSDNNNELQIVDVRDKSNPALVGSYNAPGSGDAYGVGEQEGKVYFSRNVSNKKGEDEFYIIDATDPGSPKYLASLNLEDTARAVALSGSYAYIASYDNTRELQVIDITSSTAPQRVATVDVGNYNTYNAYSITIAGNTAFLGRQDSRIYAFNVADPLNPILINPLGLSVGGYPYKTVAFGMNSYLAVACARAAREFQVWDIYNMSSPKLVGYLNIASTTNFAAVGIDYHAEKDRLVLVGASQPFNDNRQFIVIRPQ